MNESELIFFFVLFRQIHIKTSVTIIIDAHWYTFKQPGGLSNMYQRAMVTEALLKCNRCSDIRE